MDDELKRLKEQERTQWEETLSDLEHNASERSNLTINIGTDGGQVSDSDVSIHEINTARRNIERLDIELAVDKEHASYVDQRGVLELQLVNSRRTQILSNRINQDEIEFLTMMKSAEARIRRIERQQNPPLRTFIAITASRLLLILLGIALIFRDVQDYCISNPIYATGGITLVLLLAFLFWWIPQAPNGNNKQ